MNEKDFFIKQLNILQQKLNIRQGQLKYIFEYLKLNPCQYVKQGNILLYCDSRRNEDTNGIKPNFKDNSRQIEKLRKEKCPNSWEEKKINGELWFKFLPQNEIIIFKEKIFSKNIIQYQLTNSMNRCEITGLPSSEIKLSADHWISKYNNGTNDQNNCIILCKFLNEQKNKHDPIYWFCKTILTNFLNIYKKSGKN
jgi:hypothetical protein